jgi:hypothetical protein
MAKAKPYYIVSYKRKNAKGELMDESEDIRTDEFTNLRQARQTAISRMWGLFIGNGYKPTLYRVEPDGGKYVDMTTQQLVDRY